MTHAACLANVTMLTGAAVTDGHHIELALNGDGTYARLFADLAAARSSIMLQVDYGNSGRLAERLGQLLIDRARAGVAVLVLYDAFGTSALSDDYLQTLRDAGVRLYEWQPTTLHPKTFVVDGLWSTVRSMNFDNRSLALNDEATLMVHDAAFGRQMNEVFADDLRHSREIMRDAFGQRAWWHRVAESTAWTFTRLL